MTVRTSNRFAVYSLKRFPPNVRWLGPMEAVRILHRELTGRRELRRVRLTGEWVYIRTLTPDLQVAISSLALGEYAGIRCEAPTVIVDAGANIGTSAIAFARRYPGARVIALEPEAENFSILTANTDRYANIFAVNAALWGTSGTRTLRDRQTGPVGYTIAEARGATASTGQEVPCLTIPDVMQVFGIEWIDILKLDIEGGEKDVLERSGPWIAKVGIIVAELHERICDGCESAFEEAASAFDRIEHLGEKVVAYRES